MVISRATEYAIRALLYVADFPSGQIVSKRDICQTQDITAAFLIKIMQPLRDAGFVKSFRGVAGGFSLAKPAEEISLWDIVCVIEGPMNLNRCLISEGNCLRDSVCPVHRVWHKVRADLEQTLSEATLASLTQTRLELFRKE